MDHNKAVRHFPLEDPAIARSITEMYAKFTAKKCYKVPDAEVEMKYLWLH